MELDGVWPLTFEGFSTFVGYPDKQTQSAFNQNYVIFAFVISGYAWGLK